MRLRKRIGAAMLAASMALTIFPVNSMFAVSLKAAETEGITEDAKSEVEDIDGKLEGEEEETKSEEKEMEDTLAYEEEIKEDNITALDEEDNIEISDITIADTYYSVNGKFPLYVEYTTTKELDVMQRKNLKLKVIKEDGTIIAEEKSELYRDRFSISECSHIKNGDKETLRFLIVDTNVPETEKELKSLNKVVKFETKDIWASCTYLSTGTNNYNVRVYLPTSAAITTKSIDGIYLIDENNKIAAGTIDSSSKYSDNTWDDSRYDGIFENSISIEMNYLYGDLYRTRELKNNEILYGAYSANGEMHYLNDIIFTVTDKPYISNISFYLYGTDKYPGQENSNVVTVEGENIDFNKLSITLKDKKTGKIVGNSIDSMTKIYQRDGACYSIKWVEDNQSSIANGIAYNVEYNYADTETEIISEMGKTIYYSSDSNYHNIIWNPKSDTIEYYNKRIPTGIDVSYEVWKDERTTGVQVASGNASVDNTHLIKIPLKETFEQWGYYYLYVTYVDNGESKEVNHRVEIYPNKVIQGGDSTTENDYIIYQYNQNSYYLSNNKNLELSVGFYCNDINKLAATCDAVIYNSNTNQSVGNVKLNLKNDNGNLTYQGTYNASLAAGRYRLSFQPDGNISFSYNIYVEDSNRLSVRNQSNNIVNGNIGLYFVSKDIADWYCNEENQKKIKVKLLDVQKQEIGNYEFSKDFTIIDSNSNYKYIQFNDTIKNNLSDQYFCYVYIYYGEEEIAISFDYNRDSSIKSLYEYSKYNAEYIYSEENGFIYMDYRTGYGNINGKTTYSGVYGSDSAFPAILKITDWYSLQTVKEIIVPKSGYKFTEKDLEGLSPTKVYNFFLNGKDGVTNNNIGYIDIAYGDQFFTNFSKVYPVSGDFDVTFEFTNKSKGINNWENYLVCFANVFEQIVPKLNDNPGYKEYYVLRADAWGWSGGPTSAIENKTLEGNEVTYEFDWEWDQFLNMIKDSRITMNIKRVGNDFTVDAKIKGADAKDYTYKVTFTTEADKDMTIFFTNDYADVSIIKFTNNINKKPEKPDDNDNNNNNSNNNSSGNTYYPPVNVGGSSNGGTTEPVKEEQPKEEEPKQEEPKQPEEEKDTEQEKPPVKEPEDTNKSESENKTDNETQTQTKTKGKLTLKKKKMVLKKGQKSTIKITSKLNTKVTYKSLNKAIATVSKKGVVTAKKEGKATITVKANGKTKKVKVTVKAATKDNTKNSSIIKLGKNFKLSETKAVLKKGNKLTIQAAASITDKVTYKSLNKKIASVSVKGVVKAKKKGKTAITIKTGKKTIKLNVTVKR